MALNLAVKDLIPHGEPMVLLEQIESFDAESLQASLQIREDALFREAAGVPAWVGLEYMGQAIAALAGIHARQRNQPVKIGFLVSARRYEPSISHFPIGSRLLVAVSAVTFNTSGLQVFECTIHCGPDLVVKANLNVYMPENVADFMEKNSR